MEMEFPFNQIFSTEIVKSQADKLNRKFCKDTRVVILHGNSPEVLRKILPKIDHNILFWLDAHYPGADLGLCRHDSEQDIDIRLPLERELDIIFELRKGFQDVIICDDLRIYERADIENYNIDEFQYGKITKFGLDFLDKFKEKSTVNKIYRNEGYIEIVPK